jgi:hypothetical protein
LGPTIDYQTIIYIDGKELDATAQYNNMFSDEKCEPHIKYAILKFILGLKGGMANEFDTATIKRRLYDRERQQKYTVVK